MKTTIFAKSTRMMAIFAISALCVSCADSFDFEEARNPHAEEDAQYTDRFNDIVGDIDPDHSWSTASFVGAQVSVNIPGTHTLRIFNTNPNLHKAYLLGKYDVEGMKNVDINFDMPASIDKVFAVLDSGSKRKSLEAEINRNGITLLEFDQNTHHNYNLTRTSGTRADGAFTFDNDDPTVYLTTMPSGLPEISQYYNYTVLDTTNYHYSYQVSPSTSVVNAYIGNCDIYFPAGTYNITSWATRENTNVYLMPGAKVTFANGLNENYTNNVWSVPANATIEINGDLSYNFRLYNKGTIKAKNFSLYASSFVYNNGTIEVSGEASVKNASCQLVNAGTLTCSSVTIEGSGRFLNTGTTTVSGKTTVNSNFCTWGNDGSYTTDIFVYTAGSNDVYNNCDLTVTDYFRMVLGEAPDHIFRIGAGGSLVCKDFQMGIGRIDMGNKSMIMATNSAIMGITKLETYGIYGPTGTDEFALFTAPEVKGGLVQDTYYQEIENQGYKAVYGNKLYVATDNHFADGYSGQYPYIGKVGDFVGIVGEAEAPSLTTNCSGKKYTGSVPEEEYTETEYEYDEVIIERFFPWVIACEDLGNTASSDFDFNDIVFGIEISHRNNGYYASITPLAAGGTLEAYIMYKNPNGDWVSVVNPDGEDMSEIHKWISNDANADIKIMLNTGIHDISRMATTAAVALPSTFESMSKFQDYFGVLVIKDGEEYRAGAVANVDDVLKNESNGSTTIAPKMFCVEDLPFYWTKERIPIINVYSEFSSWASNHMKDQKWFEIQRETIVTEKIVTRRVGAGTGTNVITNTPTTPTPETTKTVNGYKVKVNGSEVTSLSLNHNESKSLRVEAIYSDNTTSDVTNSATFSLKNNVNGIIVDNNNKSVKGNLPIVVDSSVAPTYSFTKKEGSNFDEITSNVAVSGTLEVVSTKTTTYKAQDEVEGIVEVKIGGTTVASFNVEVTPEALTDNTKTKTETNNNVVWSGLVNGNGLSCYYNFQKTTTGTITATQEGSNDKLVWEVDVTASAGGSRVEEVLWENSNGVTIIYYPQPEFDLNPNVVKNIKNGSIIRLYYLPETDTTQGISIGYKPDQYNYTGINYSPQKDSTESTLDFTINSDEFIQVIKKTNKFAIAGDVYKVVKITLINE